MSIWTQIILGIFGILIIIIASITAVTLHRIRKAKSMAKNAVSFAQRYADGGKRLLFIGDSVLLGTGAEKPHLTIPGYFAAKYPQSHIVNVCDNGLYTKDLIEILSGMEGQYFDLAMIHTAANETLRRTSIHEIEQQIASVLKLAKTVSGHVVVLSGMDVGKSKLIPLGMRWIMAAQTRKVQRVFAQAARDANVLHVDILPAFEDGPLVQNPKKFTAGDYLHFNGEGYRYLFTFITEILEAEGIMDASK